MSGSAQQMMAALSTSPRVHAAAEDKVAALAKDPELQEEVLRIVCPSPRPSNRIRRWERSTILRKWRATQLFLCGVHGVLKTSFAILDVGLFISCVVSVISAR